MNKQSPATTNCSCNEPYGDFVCAVHNVNTTNGVSQSPATDSYDDGWKHKELRTPKPVSPATAGSLNAKSLRTIILQFLSVARNSGTELTPLTDDLMAAVTAHLTSLLAKLPEKQKYTLIAFGKDTVPQARLKAVNNRRIDGYNQALLETRAIIEAAIKDVEGKL